MSILFNDSLYRGNPHFSALESVKGMVLRGARFQQGVVRLLLHCLQLFRDVFSLDFLIQNMVFFIFFSQLSSGPVLSSATFLLSSACFRGTSSTFSASRQFSDHPGPRMTSKMTQRLTQTHENQTPFVTPVPPGVEHWKSAARAVKNHLTRFIGRSAAGGLQFNIVFFVIY